MQVGFYIAWFLDSNYLTDYIVWNLTTIQSIILSVNEIKEQR